MILIISFQEIYSIKFYGGELMGLDIVSSDNKKSFHIGYFGFTRMRGYFVLGKSEELYEDYEEIEGASMAWIPSECRSVNEEEFYNDIGDLSILIKHSDCDGKLTSEECKLLKKELIIDEKKIRSLENYNNNPKHCEGVLKLMTEFTDLINYCAENDSVELIFT